VTRRLRKKWAVAKTEGMGFYCFKFVNIEIFLASKMVYILIEYCWSIDWSYHELVRHVAVWLVVILLFLWLYGWSSDIGCMLVVRNIVLVVY